MNNCFFIRFLRSNIIFLLVFILADIVYTFSLGSFNTLEYLVIDMYISSYSLFLYGIIIVQYLFLLIRYLRFYTMYVLIRYEFMEQYEKKIRIEIFLYTIVFVFLYHFIFYLCICIITKSMFFDCIGYIVKTMILHLLFYYTLAQLTLFFYHCNFKPQYALIKTMSIYFICVFFVYNFSDYVILTIDGFNFKIVINLLIFNVLLNILSIFMKQGDYLVEN